MQAKTLQKIIAVRLPNQIMCVALRLLEIDKRNPMPFVELVPATKNQSLTGIRLSCGPMGATLTISGAALKALGTPPVGATCKIFHDADPTFPLVRIEAVKGGPFVLRKASKANGDGDYRIIRVGRALKVGKVDLRRVDCSWEVVDGKLAIDVDLPKDAPKAIAGQPSDRPARAGGSIANEPLPRPVPMNGRR